MYLKSNLLRFFNTLSSFLLFILFSLSIAACQPVGKIQNANETDISVVQKYTKILEARHIDFEKDNLSDLTKDMEARDAVNIWLKDLHEQSYIRASLKKNMFQNWCFLEPQYVDFEIILGLIDIPENKTSIAETKRDFDQFYDKHFEQILPDFPEDLDWTDKQEIGKYIRIAEDRDQADFQYYLKLSEEDRIELGSKFSFRAYQGRTNLETCAREAEANEIIKFVLNDGWPLDHIYGEGVSKDFWLLVQHNDHDTDLQKRALKELELVLHTDKKLQSSYAYLSDRIASNQGLPQIYGTQVEFTEAGCIPRNLGEPQTVDVRREKVGLEPIRDYLLGNPGCDKIGDF